jgi:hypothetical protein
MSVGPVFFQEKDLLYRLSAGVQRREQEVVFLFGAALSAPPSKGEPGVPDAASMINLARREFESESEGVAEFDLSIERAGIRKYQAAFLFLQGRLGQSAVNEVIRRAVAQARVPSLVSSGTGFDVGTASDDQLRIMDLDADWAVTPGGEAFGRLAAEYPRQFGQIALTTNFDPLLEVAVRRAGGAFFRTALHADGGLSQTYGTGCHIVHLHGYWYGSDTLHSPAQLQLPRPRLKASIASLLRDKVVLVCGYGGWEDVFTQALVDVALDDSAKPEVLWAFFGQTPNLPEELSTRLSVGINRGRISLYSGVDCHKFLPDLLNAWRKIEQVSAPLRRAPGRVRISSSIRAQLQTETLKLANVQGDDEDRPPLVDVCVGRDAELQLIRESKAKVVFLTGIGGQGKSTLAAQFFAEAEAKHSYAYLVWRDCKEEGERFENQLASVVEALSGGKISGEDLSNQPIQSIAQLLVAHISNLSALFVFDNADHYIDLEFGRVTSSVEVLMREIQASRSSSRIVITCRPSIQYDDPEILSCRLEGISLEAARKLFQARSAKSSDEEIEEAHRATDGHAFWLDLLAIQVAKQPSGALRRMLDPLSTEAGQLPEKTLVSIWETLNDRQRLILRSMAEAVRPETESEIADVVSEQMKFHKVWKALSALRSLNLVVVKRRSGMADVYELHPLIRQFIRRRFTPPERTSFIESIIRFYRGFISRHRAELHERPALTTLQYWTQGAELAITAGRTAEAIAVLVEVSGAFSASAYSREFARVMRLLLKSFDWVRDRHKYGGFETLFDFHVRTLSYLGEWPEVDGLLKQYEMTLAERDARYIFYCGLMCYSRWIRGEFSEAVVWGNRGQFLKTSSSVDTKYDPSHSLALAQRDAGQPELALPIFLQDRTIAEVLDPGELDEKKGGAHYGNIGRCLHFMGQVESALICYQKSAILIEKDPGSEHVMNQGFARRWIGELLLARKEYRLAAIFFEAARLKWELVSPPRMREMAELQHRLIAELQPLGTMDAEEIEKTCVDWISGSLSDA